MKRGLYFAYGSNMKTSRFLERIPSAKPLGRGRLHGRRLECNKKSNDGSAKANLEYSPESVVWGVLCEIDGKDWKKLDMIEGGYEKETANIRIDDGGIVEAQVYVSRKIDKRALPLDWYKSLMVDGAVEHQLPQEYVDFLRSLPSKRSENSTPTRLMGYIFHSISLGSER